MATEQRTSRNPWLWLPTLYFAEGIPNVLVASFSVAMYKRLGISNAEIAFLTSMLYWPWALKGVWSPLVDNYRTKRFWTTTFQIVMTVALAILAFVIPTEHFFLLSAILLAIISFSSATHDIAADGFYMLSLDQNAQAAYVGIRSTFYRLASVFCSGVLLVVAGRLESRGDIPLAWATTLAITAVIFGGLTIYHRFILPRPAGDAPATRETTGEPLKEFLKTFKVFFGKDNIGTVIAFLLLYRFAEAQLTKLVQPFLLDPRDKGGLGLLTEQVGFVYGTVGVIALTVGGILGGIAASRDGLKFWFWFMVFAIHLPDVAFVYLSQVQPESPWLISAAIAIEQFGYGFGFTAYMLYMIMISEGPHKTAHYAICTGFMAIGLLLPGMLSGWVQEQLGYKHFFLWVMASTIPGFLVAALVKIDPEFAKKKTLSP